jgi:flagellar biosynthesis protein FlhB
MADDLGERTEEATPRRRQEAREEGNVARSQDLTSALLLVVATVAVWAASMPMLRRGTIVLEQALDGARLADPLNIETARDAALTLGWFALLVALPVLVAAWGAAYLANLLQIGWLFSAKAAQPKLSKLNPMRGFQRIFGISGLVKVTLDSLKVFVVMLVAGLTVAQHRDRIIVLPYLEVMPALAQIGRLMLDLALRVLAVLLLLGVLDYLYQKWKHSRDLRMTKQQVKDELKQTEGDPEVRRRRFRMQQQIAQQRINAAVPKADVIVTNPEHVSVALAYEPERMGAPRVVAKGADYLALRIRQIAMQHGIPIVQRPPLARALYKDVPVGREVPPQFYQAVAEILAYVYRLSGRKAG